MSLAQIDATGLLCRLLERNKLEINGKALVGGDHADAGKGLLRERLLVVGPTLEGVTCPECGVHTARVMRELAREQILLYCDECGEVNAPRLLQETYKVSLTKLVERVMTGLGLNHSAKKEIMTDQAWRIGTTEPARGKPLTWYFARNLQDSKVAHRVRDQIRLDKASQSSKVITSTELPLPEGSPLTEFDVVNLASIARISQSKFEFFHERMSEVTPVPADDVPLGTTLRHVRARNKAFIDGVAYALEPIHVRILVALIDDFDHEMESADLRMACGSDADPFSPRKLFERQQPVYNAFIKYKKGDKVYALVVPPGDRDWLT